MSDFQKISYIDLRHELLSGRLPACIGRTAEIDRLCRILFRNSRHHAMLIGAKGSGITSFLYGFAAAAARYPAFGSAKLIMLESASLYKIGSLPAAALAPCQEAFASLDDAVVIIDDFGGFVYNNPPSLQNWSYLLGGLAQKQSVRVVLSMDPQQFDWIKKTAPFFAERFEAEILAEPSDEDLRLIIGRAFGSLPRAGSFSLEEKTPQAIIDFFRRFPALGQLPKAGIEMLDECIAQQLMRGPDAAQPSPAHPVLRHIAARRAESGSHRISPAAIAGIVSEKTGIPLQQLTADEREKLKRLPSYLKERIVGQEQALDAIAAAVQRAALGLRNARRPLASFLALGPSGVGKTETAKVLAEHMFGRTGQFLRIDMSEFTEAHTLHRLIGAPPGYAGFESGGQLTNHIKQFPYSLILLDEIEKAHAKIFDIFLQLLDDGRLTSGQGETVDATQAIIMATSNIGVEKIIGHAETGRGLDDSAFYREEILPELARHFRLEFLNRFDSVLLYNPLSLDDLTDIGLLEIKKIERRVREHNIRFRITPGALRQKISSLADPRFGARPVKRFVEDMCETLIAKQLLNS